MPAKSKDPKKSVKVKDLAATKKSKDVKGGLNFTKIQTAK